jgi:apolipoprotein N-acyltransferase
MTATNNEPRLTRRPWRTLFGLLAALVASYWVGRRLGLSNDDLLGYLLASLSMVIAAALVALLVFGVMRLFRR